MAHVECEVFSNDSNDLDIKLQPISQSNICPKRRSPNKSPKLNKKVPSAPHIKKRNKIYPKPIMVEFNFFNRESSNQEA